MATEFTDLELLKALEPAVVENLERHLAAASEWHPHDYVPWVDGRNFAFLGGVDWDPEQSKLSEIAKTALTMNLLTADNLPSYHRELAEHFSLDGPWGTWVGRWTSEENRHAIMVRDYLVVTRALDPVELEGIRMEHMVEGYSATELSILELLAYGAIVELAASITHRNTGRVCEDPVAARITDRIAQDDELQALFYRNLVARALEIAPDQTMRAIADQVVNFTMPAASLSGFSERAAQMAKAGIYDLRQHHDLVLEPTLETWRVFERNDFGPAGEAARVELAAFLGKLTTPAAES